jgi:ABC-type polysaccharide/polyol phosphate export permease
MTRSNSRYYLDFLVAMIGKEFKVRYKQAIFGFLWVFSQSTITNGHHRRSFLSLYKNPALSSVSLHRTLTLAVYFTITYQSHSKFCL